MNPPGQNTQFLDLGCSIVWSVIAFVAQKYPYPVLVNDQTSDFAAMWFVMTCVILCRGIGMIEFTLHEIRMHGADRTGCITVSRT